MTDENGGTALVELERVQAVEANPLAFFMNRFDDFSRMSAMLAKSGMYKHKTAQAVGAILLYALEMGIPITHALRGMYHIPGGSLGMEGQLMLGLARSRCGVTLSDIKRTRDEYSAVLHRGEESHPISFTTAQAATAGLLREKPDGTYQGSKDVWDKWREDMLQWRAISQGLRVIAPDFFLNIYSSEEALSLQAAHIDEHKHDASHELHGTEDIIPLIEELRELIATGEKAGVVENGFREEIMAKAELGDVEAVKQAIADLQADISAELNREADVPKSDSQPALEF